MAKTRAQRKAEKRAREAEEQRSGAQDRESESRAPHDPQVPVSGDIAEIEAVEAGMALGAPEAELETPDAPKPRALRRAEDKQAKEAEKRQREDQKRRERKQLAHNR